MVEVFRIYLDGKIVDVDAALNYNGIHSVYFWLLCVVAIPFLEKLNYCRVGVVTYVLFWDGRNS